MHICANCKKEMRCIKTGMSIRYTEDGSHVYPADTFECSECGARIAYSSGNNYYQENAKDKSILEDIWMDI